VIVIVDYGMGNLASVFNATRRYTESVEVCFEPEKIKKAKKLILPGVGAFNDAYNEIAKRKLKKPIMDFITSGRPFLGICLGLQLLFSRSYEDGEHEGFDIIPGDVVPFSSASGLKVPHMGWNQLNYTSQTAANNDALQKNLPHGALMYFVHSYYVVPKDASVVVSTTDYGVDFCSAIHKDNIHAVQFHPEKSQEQGLRIIENFVEL
jgi:imidazole glycerol-phosphate synthase subunit HisH